MMQRSVDGYRDSEALVELGGSRVTFSELWDRATACAGGLVAKGLKPGDRVTLTLQAGVDWVVGFLGVIFAG
ncbi:MAG: AMP-binding protein, partial [Acidimicrobiaceae bacterium]|nr:AMP-binding protein [Acidimicrobiaceae bacterium]